MEECSNALDIPHAQIVKYASEHFWTQRRIRAKETAFQAIKNDLAKRIENHRVKHQHFVLDQLDEVGEHIKNMTVGADKEGGEVHPMEKLATLDKHDIIARRTLKLDDEQKADPIQAGFALLVAVQTQRVNPVFVNEEKQLNGHEVTPEGEEIGEGESISTQTEGEKTQLECDEKLPPIPPSATMPLLSNKNPNTGILSSANALSDEPSTDNRASKTTEVRDLPLTINFTPPKRIETLVNEETPE